MLLHVRSRWNKSVFELLADRFAADHVPAFEGTWLDLATGRRVRLRFAAAGGRAAQLDWSERCADLACLRHPSFNDLVDYGMADRARMFEAYTAVPGSLGTPTPDTRLLEHARAFLESRSLRLDRSVAPYVIRDPRRRQRPSGRYPIGVVLQPRGAIGAVAEALAVAASGLSAVAVSGPAGCGLRTLHLLAARAARQAGYVPVAGAVLSRMPSLWPLLDGRHLCVLLEDSSNDADRSRAAAFLARIGAESTRGHVVLKFIRSEGRCRGAIEVEPMSVDAMVAMVFGGPGATSREATLRAAAQRAAGRPGAFLESLHAVRFDAPSPRVSIAREVSPAYVTSPPARPAARRCGLGHVLLDAPQRAAKLARRGRHAAAIRLLTRAFRVLEARGEVLLSAACADALGWIERARGRSGRALEAFARLRALGDDGALGIAGAVGTGIVWTDDRRFVEAEAGLRGAMAAAGVIARVDLDQRARLALARCLFWQERHGEARAILGPVAAQEVECDRTAVELESRQARLALADGDVREAMAAAARALGRADRSGDAALIVGAARAMALVQVAIGNDEQVIRWVRRGVQAAEESHLPLPGLRLRAIVARQGRDTGIPDAKHVRAALRRRQLPALVRRELEDACNRPHPPKPASTTGSADDRVLRDLQELLTLVHSAEDDGAGLEAVCRSLGERTRAATVQIVTGLPSPRNLARAGRPWQGDQPDVDRIMSGGAATPAGSGSEPHQAAEPIRYGRETIAVLCCRWTPGTPLDSSAISSAIKAAALAAAAAVRGILDRSNGNAVEPATADLIGASPSATALRDAIARAARAPFPVLIEGESGSGKELVARGVHRLGARRDRRLCTVNCAALADDLLEAELFGHTRGAFTGAVGERPGLFEEADGGTLFLDEVGELSPRAQAKLLRVLQDGEVRRVGENLPRRVDARIIAATNRRLDEEVSARRFRADLRFRLDVVRIAVPPLRERAGDVPALATHFWNEAVARVGSSATLTGEVLAALSRYDWPGNVRELQNVMASLAVHAPRRGRLPPAVLPAHIAGTVRPGTASFDAARQEFERRYVRAALAQAAGHRTRAARALGVSRQGLAKMLRRLGLDGDS
jgi:DNA-binding NtrC family response regulator/tetratricopeptide (TPR) repeat protein